MLSVDCLHRPAEGGGPVKRWPLASVEQFLELGFDQICRHVNPRWAQENHWACYVAVECDELHTYLAQPGLLPVERVRPQCLLQRSVCCRHVLHALD